MSMRAFFSELVGENRNSFSRFRTVLDSPIFYGTYVLSFVGVKLQAFEGKIVMLSDTKFLILICINVYNTLTRFSSWQNALCP